MASTEPPQTVPTPAVSEPGKAAPPPAAVETVTKEPAAAPPPETKALRGDAGARDYFPVINVVLRVLLFATALIAVVVIGTSKETELVSIPFPPFQVPLSAKFNYSPALVYFVAALSVTGLYAIITTILSIFKLLKPTSSSKLLAHFIIFDVLLLGIVASATGSAGAVSYLGLKGNSHVRWTKVCDAYGTYCRHVASSVAFSLIGSIVLVFLILLSVRSISKKIPK